MWKLRRDVKGYGEHKIATRKSKEPDGKSLLEKLVENGWREIPLSVAGVKHNP